MKKVKELFEGIEIKEGFSLTSKHFSLSALFQQLPKNRIVSNLYSKMQDNTINEYLINKTYTTKEFTLNMNMIEMNNTTDELLLLSLLSFNRSFLEITLKDLNIVMGYGKESGKTKTKDRVMDSLNKLLKCSFNINFENGDNLGFHILKYNYTLNEEGTKTLKVYFDEDFINLYNSSNNGYIDLRIHKALSTDYEKSLYSMLTNFYSDSNKISINKKVMFEKFGKDFLQRDKKCKINKALKSLKEKDIIASYNISKLGNLTVVKCKTEKAIINKIKTQKENDKMINNTPTLKAEKLLDLPEDTKEQAIRKIEKIEEMSSNFHNGLTPKENVMLNRKVKALKELLAQEEESKVIEIQKEDIIIVKEESIKPKRVLERVSGRTSIIQ